MDQNKNKIHRAFAWWVAAAYLNTGMQSAVRYGGKNLDLSTRQALSARYIGGVVLSALLVVIIRRSLRPFATTNWRLQAKASIATACMTAGVFTATNLIGVGRTTAFAYAWPAFSLALSWLPEFGEKPDFRAVMSIVVTLIGVGALAMAMPSVTNDPSVTTLGILAVLGASIGNAYRINLTPAIKRADPDPFTGVLWMMLVGAVASAAWDVTAGLMPGSASTLPMGVNSAMVMVAIAACGVASLYANMQAQSLAPTRVLTPTTAFIQLPFALSLGHFAFGEPWPSLVQTIWMALIVIGGLLVYVPMERRSNGAS